MEEIIVSAFSSICEFFIANKASIGSKVIASATYDGLKKVLKFSSLKEKIKRFFNKEEDIDNYLERICSTEVVNKKKPFRDIEDHYEELTGNEFNNEMLEEIKQWVEQNQEDLIKTSNMNFKNDKGFNIGVQKAGKNIFNIQGDYKSKG